MPKSSPTPKRRSNYVWRRALLGMRIYYCLVQKKYVSPKRADFGYKCLEATPDRLFPQAIAAMEYKDEEKSAGLIHYLRWYYNQQNPSLSVKGHYHEVSKTQHLLDVIEVLIFPRYCQYIK